MQRLHYAVAASVLLHALILWPDNSRPIEPGMPGPMQASLRLPPPQPRSPAAASAPSIPARAIHREIPPPAPIIPAPAAPISPPRQEILAAARPTSASANRAPVLPVAAPSVIGGAIAPRRAPSAQAGPTSTTPELADGLRGYRIAVAREARRFKRYPPQATASGWEGIAEIAVEVGADGQPQPATLARSSGHEPLDRAALTMIDAGAQRARLPETLRGRSFAVKLPVVFDLAEQ